MDRLDLDQCVSLGSRVRLGGIDDGGRGLSLCALDVSRAESGSLCLVTLQGLDVSVSRVADN